MLKAYCSHCTSKEACFEKGLCFCRYITDAFGDVNDDADYIEEYEEPDKLRDVRTELTEEEEVKHRLLMSDVPIFRETDES